MLCETCRWTERPGFVRGLARGGHVATADLIPCPECGGQGVAHCCDGICEQPNAGEAEEPECRTLSSDDVSPEELHART
jgi:hypothetical protein